MKKRTKTILWLESALCALAAFLWIAAAVRICREGLAARAAGDPLAPVFTREIVRARALPGALALCAAVAVAVAARLLRVRTEDGEKRGGSSGTVRAVPPVAEGKRTRTVRITLLVFALALIAAGILNGSARDVLVKAAHLCTECVGLG